MIFRRIGFVVCNLLSLAAFGVYTKLQWMQQRLTEDGDLMFSAETASQRHSMIAFILFLALCVACWLLIIPLFKVSRMRFLAVSMIQQIFTYAGCNLVTLLLIPEHYKMLSLEAQSVVLVMMNVAISAFALFLFRKRPGFAGAHRAS